MLRCFLVYVVQIFFWCQSRMENNLLFPKKRKAAPNDVSNKHSHSGPISSGPHCPLDTGGGGVGNTIGFLKDFFWGLVWKEVDLIWRRSWQCVLKIARSARNPPERSKPYPPISVPRGTKLGRMLNGARGVLNFGGVAKFGRCVPHVLLTFHSALLCVGCMEHLFVLKQLFACSLSPGLNYTNCPDLVQCVSSPLGKHSGFLNLILSCSRWT